MIPIIFDLDGTLIDSLPDITDATNALLAGEGLPSLSSRETAGFVGRGERVFLERLIAATDLSMEDFDALLPRFIKCYKDAARKTKLMPGAADALAEAKARGIKVGLCTNKPRAALLPTLEAGGLDDVFDVVIAGDDLEHRKPHPAPLWHAMKMLGAETCIYVGDSEVDAETAQRAGMPFALFTEGIRVSEVEEIPHSVAFSDFRDFSEIYQSLMTHAVTG